MKYDILIWAYGSHIIYASFHDKFCDIQYLWDIVDM
jgi:hypothetical protein